MLSPYPYPRIDFHFDLRPKTQSSRGPSAFLRTRLRHFSVIERISIPVISKRRQCSS